MFFVPFTLKQHEIFIFFLSDVACFVVELIKKPDIAASATLAQDLSQV